MSLQQPLPLPLKLMKKHLLT